ncbi:hypothetical protein ULMS_24260 [Patiriisocius marinistellae]|uniref:Phosphoadenosine phosphosulphate reductase domain-containing protein n=1 Tax=Patiriisocius marinistellae TaxID=2494560 RepID=A0A5J4FZP7_9FLAO|nr:phosphoadenosine phosphosulfate reductase family protein [Patiriisocius marinistellae]GEQ86918.1 hypothetical protein ULMS_24260 [Patiriisocius marinistellae]
MNLHTITTGSISELNKKYRFSQPKLIIEFALSIAKNPLLTTSFGPNSAAILHSVATIKNDIQVVWCDTGHNTNATIKHAAKLQHLLTLNLDVFRPKRALPIPTKNKNDTQEFELFVDTVKLEPFARAIKQYKPDVWFTTVRKKQGAYRDELDIFSITNDGVLRVSPFYHFNNEQITSYLNLRGLPIEYDYFDPTKPDANSECGIQFLV